jgi:hypothetical protein
MILKKQMTQWNLWILFLLYAAPVNRPICSPLNTGLVLCVIFLSSIKRLVYEAEMCFLRGRKWIIIYYLVYILETHVKL